MCTVACGKEPTTPRTTARASAFLGSARSSSSSSSSVSISSSNSSCRHSCGLSQSRTFRDLPSGASSLSQSSGLCPVGQVFIMIFPALPSVSHGYPNLPGSAQWRCVVQLRCKVGGCSGTGSPIGSARWAITRCTPSTASLRATQLSSNNSTWSTWWEVHSSSSGSSNRSSSG